mmetsp:Transcript_20577/g.83478  ORF Transcript_20577/g.83478 Transcript_20577/m.83478 type:complete len:92 (-) Transcript_20577:2219-2494(-)
MQIRSYADWLTGNINGAEEVKKFRSGHLLHEIGARLKIAAGEENPGFLKPSKADLKLLLLSGADGSHLIPCTARGVDRSALFLAEVCSWLS